MPSLPTDTNDSPNYTPAQHAGHHNDLHAFNNAYLPVPAVYQQDSEPVGAPDGSWWIDTDEPSQSGSSVRGSLGYAERTTDQTGITTEVDLTSLTVTVTVNSGERIRVSAEMFIASTVANDVGSLRIKEGATILSQGAFVVPTGGFRCHVSVILTPTAASHTYKLALARAVGSGNISMNAGVGYPAYILVEGIGT